MDFGQGSKGQPLRVLGVPTLQLFDFRRGHRFPDLQVRTAGGITASLLREVR
jgi:hypothetical protein